jgi:tetratricopeptide (TPR) repeat protein
LSRTPDGRIVSELHRARKEQAQRHGDTLVLQRELVTALKGLHGGSTVVRREDFDKKAYETQRVLKEAAFQMGALNQRGEGLLEETRVLARIAQGGFNGLIGETRSLAKLTAGGFDDLGRRIDHTTHAVHEVESAVRAVGREVVSSGSALARQAREAQGPRYTKETPREFIRTNTRFMQILSAHQNGLLNEDASGDLELLLDTRLASPTAKRFIEGVIENKIADATLKREGREILTLVDHPSRLAKRATRDGAVQQLRRLEKVVGEFPNQDVESFIQDAYALLNVCDQARQSTIEEDLLIDMSNNNLVVEGISYEVKKRYREARVDGSALERSFSLIDLLIQGDKAIDQREIGIGELRRHTVLGEILVVGQEHEIAQRERGNHLLSDIAVGIVGTNQHLVNLEELAAGFIEAMNYGFSQVNGVLERGVNLGLEALDAIATQIAISKAAILSQLRQIDSTLERGNANIQKEVQQGNALLERLIDLTEDSLGNVAKQRLRQGTVFLRSAEAHEDFREALKLFMEGVQADPTVMGNQYGAGVSAEVLGEDEEAMKRYRIVGRMSENVELASEAWTKYAGLKSKTGELPEALTSLRRAVEADKGNVKAQFTLVRALLLAGLVDEASEVVLELITRNIRYLYALDLEMIFGEQIAKTIYRDILKNISIILCKPEFQGATDCILEELVLFCLEKCVETEDERILATILETAPELFYIDIFLGKERRVGVFRQKATEKIEFTKLRPLLKRIIENKPNRFKGKTWMVLAALALRYRFATEDAKAAIDEVKKTLEKSKIAWIMECLTIDPEKAHELAAMGGIEYPRIVEVNLSKDPRVEGLIRSYGKQYPAGTEADISLEEIGQALGRENPLTGQSFINSLEYIEKGSDGETIFWVEDQCLKIADCRMHRNTQGKTFIENNTSLMLSEGLTIPTNSEIEQIASRAKGHYGSRAMMVQLAPEGRHGAVVYQGKAKICFDEQRHHPEMGTMGILRIPLQ